MPGDYKFGPQELAELNALRLGLYPNMAVPADRDKTLAEDKAQVLAAFAISGSARSLAESDLDALRRYADKLTSSLGQIRWLIGVYERSARTKGEAASRDAIAESNGKRDQARIAGKGKEKAAIPSKDKPKPGRHYSDEEKVVKSMMKAMPSLSHAKLADLLLIHLKSVNPAIDHPTVIRMIEDLSK